AQEFSDDLALLEKMEYSPQKEAKAKQLQVQLNQLTISAVTKTQLKERFAKVAKANLDQQKAFLKAENKTVTDTIAKHFTENPESKRLVVRVPISANSKAISEAIKTISSKQKDKTIYLIAADEKDGKVVHGCHVSAEAKEKGADAPAWANEVAGVLGGKAGGKGATSLGQGTQPENADQAVELATKYLEKLGL
ncbi:alanyl-tRNA synthetase, partial [Aureobasidium melanogenum]